MAGHPILSAFVLTGILLGDSTGLSEAVQKAVEYSRQGRNQEAEKASADALSLLEKSPGPLNFDLAANLNTLATLAYARGELNRAAELFERSRDVYLGLVSPDDVRLASILYNLAGVYVEQGSYAQAVPLYRRSIEIREKRFGTGDRLVAEVWNNLGFLFLQQGKYKEAESWLEKALALWENATGSDVAYAAIALNNLAMVRRLQGNIDDSESLYKRALAVEEKVFGRDHPELATTTMSLGALQRASGKSDKAMETYRQALTVLEKTVGPQDPLWIEAREQLNELSGAENRGEYWILLVRKKEEAEELRRRIQQGENFAELARRHSIDPNASNGGYFQARPSELREELRVQLERLEKGQVSAPFPLGGNWAVVKK
jgi:tetratricopeptide (TPR) repeat protein